MLHKISQFTIKLSSILLSLLLLLNLPYLSLKMDLPFNQFFFLTRLLLC